MVLTSCSRSSGPKMSPLLSMAGTPWAISFVHPWFGQSWPPPGKGPVKKCSKDCIKAKSTCPRIVKTKLPLLHVPELHLPETIGSGLATGASHVRFNLSHNSVRLSDSCGLFPYGVY